MMKRTARSALLQAASILVLTSGTAFASGLEVGVGGNASAGAGVGAGDSGASANVGSGADVGVGADGDGVGIHLGTNLDANVEARGDHTTPEPGSAEAGADAGASAGVGVDADVEAGDGASADANADASFAGWTLAEFSGKRVSTTAGREIGTVVSVVADAGGSLHLVTAVDAMSRDDVEKVVPLDHFTPQSGRAGLTLTGSSEAALAAMADYGSVASAYTLVESTAALQAALSTAAGTR